MIVLGLSGLENSVPFKKALWPGLEVPEYRISQGHDSAAALVVDGQIVAAAAEERFSRKKHTGDFPKGAIDYCLSAWGIEPSDIDEIAHSFDYTPYRPMYLMDPVSAEQYNRVFSREVLIEQLKRTLPGFPVDRLHQVNHHLAHAASAYFTSGWEECLVVVIDGMGEAQSATVFDAYDNEL
jgi:carbamoyltransferase